MKVEIMEEMKDFKTSNLEEIREMLHCGNMFLGLVRRIERKLGNGRNTKNLMTNLKNILSMTQGMVLPKLMKA